MFDWLRKKLRGQQPSPRPTVNAPEQPAGPMAPANSAAVPAKSGGPDWGCWVWLELPWEHPERFLGYVYVDPQAGLSAKGDRERAPDLVERPGFTVRLPMERPFQPLTPEELAARGLPPAPPWLHFYGPQPDPDSAWRQDPHLQGHFHESHPNDLQVLVHDGEPRRTRRPGELCWVRVLRAEPGPARRAIHANGQTERSESAWVYVARLINVPHALLSVRQGEELRFLSGSGLKHPLHVTPQYLQEREEWRIDPCNQCGWSECMDPPSIMARHRFPDMPPDAMAEAFTSFCPMCNGIQMLAHRDADVT